MPGLRIIPLTNMIGKIEQNACINTQSCHRGLWKHVHTHTSTDPQCKASTSIFAGCLNGQTGAYRERLLRYAIVKQRS